MDTDLRKVMQSEKDGSSVPAAKEGWVIRDLADEASLTDEDQIQRQILRGDESKGDPDERDVAGAVGVDETPPGGDDETVIKRGANDNG